MARKRKGQAVDGWLNFDKPEGMTSTQAVGAVRRLFDAAKAGHGGTLDPLACGVLPIALGEATKTVPYVMDGRKIYRWRLAFGEERTTDDREGSVTVTSPHRPTAAEIVAALPAFTGTIQQIPPAFSALKIDGERAYDLARAGETVDLAPRAVTIERFTLLGMPDPDHADFETVAGKGTYIRSLGRDVARAVGAYGHVVFLRRTQCGPFAEERAISLETLRGLGQGPALRARLSAIETALDDIPALALTQEDARRLRHGMSISLPVGPVPPFISGTIVRAMENERVVALTRVLDGFLHPIRVFVDHPLTQGEPDVDYR